MNSAWSWFMAVLASFRRGSPGESLELLCNTDRDPSGCPSRDWIVFKKKDRKNNYNKEN